jgi:hypothetical protein
MATKWSEIRRTLSPEAEARIRQRVANAGKVMALYAAETDPKLRELAETDSEAYLQIKQAGGSSESNSEQQQTGCQ